MEVGLLVIRIVVGALMAGHGAQKLFGWFGGYGIGGTGGFFESLGMRPGRVHAFAAGAAEFTGGVLLALGLLTPLAAMLIIAVMVVAIITVHWSKGVWSSEGGYEYNAVVIAVAFALAAVGPGEWSLDHAFGFDLSGVEWGIAALGLGVLGAALTVAYGRMQTARATAGRERPSAA